MIEGLERLLVEQLELAPVELAPGLALARGALGARAVELSTRCFRGPLHRHVRLARLEGEGIAIANVLALPRADRDLPVLGADLVALPGADLLLVVDLSPTVRRLAPAVSCTFPSAGELPAWAARVFSPHAVFARVPSAQRADALEVIAAHVEVLASLPADPGDAAEPQRRYLAAHREDERLLGPLRAAFGAAWTARYLDEVFFPDP